MLVMQCMDSQAVTTEQASDSFSCCNTQASWKSYMTCLTGITGLSIVCRRAMEHLEAELAEREKRYQEVIHHHHTSLLTDLQRLYPRQEGLQRAAFVQPSWGPTPKPVGQPEKSVQHMQRQARAGAGRCWITLLPLCIFTGMWAGPPVTSHSAA